MEMRLDGPQMAVFMDFENVATSAEANLGDFDVNTVMDLLRSRGRLLIKRAYGDWGRFHRYRRPMLENGIDLFQLYSVGVQHKNRADVPWPSTQWRRCSPAPRSTSLPSSPATATSPS